eukprot:15457799-Alexandrium_andersonii.AAC.1
MLAALGSNGKFPGNMERDLHRHVRKQLPLDIEPLVIQIPHMARIDKGSPDFKDSGMLTHSLPSTPFAAPLPRLGPLVAMPCSLSSPPDSAPLLHSNPSAILVAVHFLRLLPLPLPCSPLNPMRRY